MGGNETQLLVVFPLSLGPCMAPMVPVVSTKCSWTEEAEAGMGKNTARIAKYLRLAIRVARSIRTGLVVPPGRAQVIDARAHTTATASARTPADVYICPMSSRSHFVVTTAVYSRL
jgi:hypothetical protein